MSLYLQLAAALAFVIGLAHSLLGERYILTRLFRRGDLPRLFGGQEFTRRTLRFAWHVTTIAWWGIAVLLLLIAVDADSRTLLRTIAATFLLTALVAAVGSRGRHLSWLVFAAIASLVLVAAETG